ncbi:MAG: glycine betaine ABC transporter substrate-binding protein, partial [Actinomycetota bacterium]
DESGPHTAAALREGHVHVALMFTTDGAIDANRFVVLEDDRQLQPAENVTPVVRQEILDRFGARVAVVADAVSASLTTRDLRGMNADVAGGLLPRDVAARWLAAHGLPDPVE